MNVLTNTHTVPKGHAATNDRVHLPRLTYGQCQVCVQMISDSEAVVMNETEKEFRWQLRHMTCAGPGKLVVALGTRSGDVRTYDDGASTLCLVCGLTVREADALAIDGERALHATCAGRRRSDAVATTAPASHRRLRVTLPPGTPLEHASFVGAGRLLEAHAKRILAEGGGRVDFEMNGRTIPARLPASTFGQALDVAMQQHPALAREWLPNLETLKTTYAHVPGVADATNVGNLVDLVASAEARAKRLTYDRALHVVLDRDRALANAYARS